MERACSIPEKSKNFSSMGGFVEKIPSYFLQTANSCGDPDRLLRQVTYSPMEKNFFSGGSLDPVGDEVFIQGRGILQKYYGRALLIVTGACFGHCRYCFRKNFSYEQQAIRSQDLENIISWFKENPDVKEVILSGGDPLFVSNAKLRQILDGLDAVISLRTVRVHTRVLSFSPQRIDEKLVSVFCGRKWKTVWVTHFNHEGEITKEVEKSLQTLRKIPGVIFLNQSVLLNGVNDTEKDLILLSESLFGVGILPYYLHQLDKVQGAAHFEVSVERGKFLVEAIREKLPGYLVPRYVQEICGKNSKTSII